MDTVIPALAVLALLASAGPARAQESDVGLRIHDGSGVQRVAVEPGGASPLKVRRGGQTFGVMLVALNDPDATRVRVRVGGNTRAVKRFNPAKWYQAPYNTANCVTFCRGLGKNSMPGPEGHFCASGEMRPKSAIDQGMRLVHGCWGACPFGFVGYPRPGSQTSCGSCDNGPCDTLPGNFWACWHATQKKDCDATDAVIACFCG